LNGKTGEQGITGDKVGLGVGFGNVTLVRQRRMNALEADKFRLREWIGGLEEEKLSIADCRLSILIND
jgi:hypothetical protein